jgi:hypothetical protein
MADHLPLGTPTALSTKRGPGFNSKQVPFDRPAHATTLAGVLAGLESGGMRAFKEFSVQGDSADEDGAELEEMGTIVLKFTTKGAPKRGPFGKWQMIPVGETSDNEYYVLSSETSRQIFANVVATYGTTAWDGVKAWEAQLDNVMGVTVYGRNDRMDPSLADLDLSQYPVVDVVLWPTSILSNRSAGPVARERLTEITTLINEASSDDSNIRVVAVDSRPDTLLLRASVNAAVLGTLLSHHFVQRVRGPLSPVIAPSHLMSGSSHSDSPQPEGASIGVVDDLIVTANPLMSNVVVQRAAFPADFSFGTATNHGTTVASIAAYGDLRPIVHGAAAPAPFPILAARVSQADQNLRPMVVGTVVEQFEQALTWIAKNEGRIAVIAFNYPHADSEALPTELTATIDRLARDLKLVVVISAGNVVDVDPLHWKDDYPSYLDSAAARVASPGGAALALTVGAIADSATPQGVGVAIAPQGSISPFSRTGPTRGHTKSGTQKPEFSAPGGNWAWDTGATAPRINDTNLGVVALSNRATRPFEVTTGTSVAAPYVAHEVAIIATRYPDAGPNLLRAITALSTPRRTTKSSSYLGDAIGHAYGVPDASRILESGMNRAVVVYEGDMIAGSRVIHELPIPEEFARGAAGSQRSLRIALAFDPPVRRSRREYMAGHMKFDFVRNMPLEDVVTAYEKQPHSAAEREIDPSLPHAYLPEGHERPGMLPITTALGSNTLVRRDFTGGFDAADESYFLVIYHDQSQWTQSQKKEYPRQSYALAIEIVDEARTDLDLHALVEAQLDVRLRARLTNDGRRSR